MIAKRSYADYTDRSRPAPLHREWAQYMGWVTENLGLQNSGSYIHGTLKEIGKRDDRWVVQYAPGDSQDAEAEIKCDAIVITGPGEPEAGKESGGEFLINNGRPKFWERREHQPVQILRPR